MKYEIHGENIEMTEAINDYIVSKIGKIERYFDKGEDIDLAVMHANIEVHKKESKLEVTIPLKNVTLRAEETKDDLYAAIDAVVGKLERQVRKYKTRINRDTKRKKDDSLFQEDLLQFNDDNEEEEDHIEIVKSKHFNLKPMDEIEAVLQMDMLNHDFFVFTDSETEGTSIVYKRKDGKYGLIEVN